MAYWSWSLVAANNSSADPTINFAEGQAPGSLNDSNRAEMARLAEARDDQSGLLTTAGTSTAYTLATNQNFAFGGNVTLIAGFTVAFCPHTTNGPNATLVTDGLAAKPLRTAPNIAAPGGVLIAGTPYRATFFTTNGGEWILHSTYGNVFGVPVGGFIPFLSLTPPNSNFALPFGQAISRTTFSVLFAMIGTTFGVGDGATTFNIPDLQGRSIFGQDNMSGAPAGRITAGASGINGSVLGAAGGVQTYALLAAEHAAHTHANSLNDPTHAHNIQYTLGSPAMTPGGNANIVNSLGTGPNVAASNAAATGLSITNASQGSGTAHQNMPPAMVLPILLRVQ